MYIMSFSPFGYEGELIKVEADLRNGLPVTDIVGLPGSAVKEARERVKIAVRNSGIDFPPRRILINLSPANYKKDGTGFDLAIALAVLYADISYAHKIVCLGELELSGAVRAVPGVSAAILSGIEHDIHFFIIPKENEQEVKSFTQVKIFAVETLNEAIAALTFLLENNVSCTKSFSYIFDDTPPFSFSDNFELNCYEDVCGQQELLRVMEIAAAGGHNMLLYGPPGCGKTMALKRFLCLLPDLDARTQEEVSRIYSVADAITASERSSEQKKRPPFRMPHQNASIEGIIGGGEKCNPGEVSLAHGGVLFLDEATQFKTSVLQTLRAPLESGRVTVSRAGRSSTFPADFQLLMAVNPCPCGNFATRGKICTCTPLAIERHWRKMTAPLLDRIDIRFAVFPPKPAALLQSPVAHQTKNMQKRVIIAQKIQYERNGIVQKTSKYKRRFSPRRWKNAWILPSRTREICKLSAEAKRLFEKNVIAENLSARASHALLKLSRSIADLEQSSAITSNHFEEARALHAWLPILSGVL